MPFARHLHFTLFMLLCLAALPLHAQEATKERAQSLQNHFQSVLENKKKSVEANAADQRKLQLEGAVSVEPVDDYYAITLPPMRVLHHDKTQTRIGMISMNANAHNKPSQLKITMALPTPILGFDANGQEIIRITIGEQKTAGIWHEELESFVKLDALYKDVRIELGGGDVTLHLPEILIRYDLEEDEEGLWSGPTYLHANNITLDTQTQDVSGSIENITLSMKMDQLSPQAFNTGKTGISERLNMADGMETRLSINGVKLSNTDQSLALENAAFLMRFSDALSGSANVHFGFSFKGLASTDLPQDLTDLAPRDANFSLTHHNIPLEQIREALGNNASKNTQIAGLSILLKLPALFSQARSTIEIKDTFVSNDNYHMDLNSILRADITATHSATAAGTLSLSGLDKILSILQVSATNAETGKHGSFMRTLARLLERLKPIGKIETHPERGFIHVFDFEVGKDGQFLVNGQNAMLLLDKDPSPPAQQAPAPAP